jgi:hypothetical protein
MIGITTLSDSLRCVKRNGIVCMTGIVGNKWPFDEFQSGGAGDFMTTRLQELVNEITAARYTCPSIDGIE